MTPKEKAEELLKKFALGGWPKENALNAVDYILEVVEDNCLEFDDNYWQEVKQEIEKI